MNMFSPRKGGAAQAYANVGLETAVLSASPVQLITLLIDGALASMAKARLYIQNGNIAGRGQAISKAIEIIDGGLQASLNTEAGGEVAKNLQSVYEIVVYQLLQANLAADLNQLDRAYQLLDNIGQAWRTLAQSSAKTEA